MASQTQIRIAFWLVCVPIVLMIVYSIATAPPGRLAESIPPSQSAPYPAIADCEQSGGSASNCQHVLLGPQGKYDQAITDYTQAIAQNPDNLTAYLKRAEIYARQAKHELALGDYNQAIRLDPVNPATLLSRGDEYAELGQYQHAAVDYRRAMQISRDLAVRAVAQHKLAGLNSR